MGVEVECQYQKYIYLSIQKYISLSTTMYIFLLLALPAVWGDWTSQETLQEQSALVAELSLDSKMNDCLLRTYCLVGAHETRVGTIAEAISSTHQVFSQIQSSLSQYWDQMTNIRKLKTALISEAKLASQNSAALFSDVIWR